MRKFSFLFFFTLLLSQLSVRGQSEAQISQYMFCMESFNPAVLASNKGISLVGLYRQQWVGITNAPQTTFFEANSPFVLFDRKQALGLAFLNDKAGIFSTQSVNLQYALQYKLGDGVLNFGVNLGFLSETIHGDSVHKVTSDYHQMSEDPAIPTQSVSDVTFDLGLGAMYFTEKYYLGLSVLHLFEPVLQMDDYVSTFVGRTTFFTCGYNLPLQNRRFQLKPSLLFKTDFISYQTDVSLRLEKDEKYWGGLSWRLQDAVIFFVGMNMFNGLSIGYSYDLSTSKLIGYSYGSHELFLKYNINLGKNKLNRYKSVRIL